MVTRRNFLASVAAVAVSKTVRSSAQPSTSAETKPTERPNFLIFMPDQTQGATGPAGSSMLDAEHRSLCL